MSECKLNHTLEDVLSKLESQQPYVPESIFKSLSTYLQQRNVSQDDLNEIFHLLKKYDLAAEVEQADRDHKLIDIMK